MGSVGYCILHLPSPIFQLQSPAPQALFRALLTHYGSNVNFHQAAHHQTLASFQNYGLQVGCSFAAAWHAVGVSDAFWHGAINDWGVTYMGWVWFPSSNGTFFLNENWYWYSNYNSATGGMYIQDGSSNWYHTSAENFPWYWSYATSSWKYFTGVYQ